MKTLGLDISSSKIGIALLDDEEIVISDVLKFKSNQSLEERAALFERRMREVNKHYVVFDVYVEQPAIMFRGGKTTAFTMATLQRFNGMCSFAVRRVFGQSGTLISANKARKLVGLKIKRGEDTKKKVIEWVETYNVKSISEALKRLRKTKVGIEEPQNDLSLDGFSVVVPRYKSARLDIAPLFKFLAANKVLSSNCCLAKF